MKKILCFGDSNTFGFNPKNGTRFDKNTRWSGILSFLCKGKYEIIEAGCNNRTCFFDNLLGKELTGYKILPDYLSQNIDIVILAIGINDLQKSYNATESNLENGIKTLINIVKDKLPKSQIIVISPPIIQEEILNSFFKELFDVDSLDKSHILRKIYKEVAVQNNCLYIDTEQITKTSIIDGLHYDKDGHNKLANAIFKMLS